MVLLKRFGLCGILAYRAVHDPRVLLAYLAPVAPGFFDQILMEAFFVICDLAWATKFSVP